MKSWSLIVICYNEAGSIAQVIDSARSLLFEMNLDDFEIIVVDDGSKDGSREIIEKCAAENEKVRAIYHQVNQGIGATIISGYRASKFDRVCMIPGDGQFMLEQLKQFQNITDNTIISFYREKNKIYSPRRKVLSWINRQILASVFGIKIKDINWVKIYPGNELRKLTFELDSSLVESEVMIKLISKNAKLIEVPTFYLERISGKPKGASLKIVLQALTEIPKLFVIIIRYRLSLRRS